MKTIFESFYNQILILNSTDHDNHRLLIEYYYLLVCKNHYSLCRLAQSVKGMMALAICLSYPLQFSVPFDVIWKSFGHRVKTMPLLIEYLLRIILVVFTGN